MKKTVLIVCCLLFTQLLTNCSKTNDGTFTEPITIYEKIGGTWELTRVNLVDEIAAANSLKPDLMNLTTKLNFRTFRITLNMDDRFKPTTFEVSGNAPGLFLKSGYWNLSNLFPNTDATPVKLQLFSDEARTSLVDVLSITSLPGNRATMDLTLTRVSGGVPFISYQYSLKQ